MLIASPGDTMELKSCMEYLVKKPQPSYLRLEKSSNYRIHKKKPKVFPGKWLKVKEFKNNTNNKEIYLTTGSVIEFVEKKIGEKKYKPRPLFSLPLWGMKYKKSQSKYIKKFNKIHVIEDHFKDGVFQSWLNESLRSSKLVSKALDAKVAKKVGSKNFLMNYLG